VNDLFYPPPPPQFVVRVIPRASRNLVKRQEALDGQPLFRVYVTTVAEDGKANAAVLERLADALGVAKSRLEIVRGHTSRLKVIRWQP
jgi:uncharacterized protein